MKVKGTVKVAVLENCGPLNASPLVAASVYDNKGIHFLITCVEKVEWVEKLEWFGIDLQRLFEKEHFFVSVSMTHTI